MRQKKTRRHFDSAGARGGVSHSPKEPGFFQSSFFCSAASRNLNVPEAPEQSLMGDVTDNPTLRERRFVFEDRHDAGRQLGALLQTLPAIRNPLVLAIPAGGVPVGREIAAALGAPLSLAVVRKIRIPGTTESGFGAVSWDGQVLINEPLRAALGLSATDIEKAVAQTRENVSTRVARFTGGRPVPAMEGKTVILTDDGLASGFTMLAAVQSIRRWNPARVVIAVPTASASSAELVSRHADFLVCLNIRSGWTFAVADAYRKWYDLDDREVLEELAGVP
jgi:predicted phosphoribosyltransferase